MAGAVVDKDLGYAKIMASINELAGEEVSVLIGVHGAKDSEMVVIAATSEFGTTTAGPQRNITIPERSYLRSTVDNGVSEIMSDLSDAVEDALDGGNLDQRLGLVGEKWTGEVKRKIASHPPPVNKPSTLKRKGEGKGTLIDTGILRNSITWSLQKGPTESLDVP